MEVRSVEQRGRIETGRVVVRFLDNELMEGTAVNLDLDRPDFELRFGDATNNRVALVPLPAVKSVCLSRRPLEEWSADWPLQRIAVHFRDGEVLKGLLGGPPERCGQGIVLVLVSPARREVETLGIPYPALKALFFLKSWDSRAPELHPRADGTLWLRRQTPLVDLLGEIESLESLRRSGEIDAVDFQRRRRDVLKRI